MTALANPPTLFDTPATLFDALPAVDDALPAASDEVGGEPTLDEILTGAWEGLTAHKSVACPMCGDAMVPEYGAHALPIGGGCRSCGTRLS